MRWDKKVSHKCSGIGHNAMGAATRDFSPVKWGERERASTSNSYTGQKCFVKVLFRNPGILDFSPKWNLENNNTAFAASVKSLPD